MQGKYEKANSNDSDIQYNFGDRLFHQRKGNPRPEKTADDSLVSNLPVETLKWIKKRRTINCKQKVVLSHHRERQLREIFNGIDVSKKGEIDIAALEEAIEFVEERIKKIKGLEALTNLKAVFRSMDEDGNGNVDFQEFTSAMTGSTKSMLDSIPAFGIDLIYQLFVEFGQLKQRNTALMMLISYSNSEKNPIPANSTAPTATNIIKKRFENQDSDNYHHFKAMFGTGSSAREEAAAATDASVAVSKTLTRIVDDFVDSVSLSPASPTSSLSVLNPARDQELQALENKLRKSRHDQIEQLVYNQDYIQQLKRLKQEKEDRARIYRPSADDKSPLSPFPSTFIYQGHLSDKAAHEVAVAHSVKKTAYEALRNSKFSRQPPSRLEGSSGGSGLPALTRLPSGASNHSADSVTSRAYSQHSEGENSRASTRSLKSAGSVRDLLGPGSKSILLPHPRAGSDSPSLFAMSSISADLPSLTLLPRKVF